MYEFLNNAEFKLESISWHRGINHDAGVEFGHRISKTYELDYIIKSYGGQILIDDVAYDCEPDTVIFRGPGHRVVGKGGYESFYIQLSVNSNITPEYLTRVEALTPQLYTLMYELFNMHRDGQNPLREFHTKRILYAIFGELVKAQREHVAHHTKDKVYSTVTQYINSHYMRKLTLDKIADRTGISKYTLCRVFKEKCGISLFDYIEIVRINNAVVLLNEKKFTVKEACFDSGFKSMSTFFRVFKKVTGKTPAEYRQHMDTDEGLI